MEHYNLPSVKNTETSVISFSSLFVMGNSLLMGHLGPKHLIILLF